MKRLLIGFAAFTFALAPTFPASAMPCSHPTAIVGSDHPTLQVPGQGRGPGRARGEGVADVG